MAKKAALRDVYGSELVELGKLYDNLYVMDADLSTSTKTQKFREAFPDRFINCGIAEANMVSAAAGMASCGNIVFVSGFAMFLAGRAYDQIRNSLAYTELNVKIVATHAGITVGEDGATHQCLEDIALMRAVPGLMVLSPSDAAQTAAALKFAVEYNGPVYIRLGRVPVDCFYESDEADYSRKKSYRISEGSFATLIFTGSFINQAVQIKKIFNDNNLPLRIVDMPFIKPLDTEEIKAALCDTGFIITLEEHNIYGGFGSAVCECVTELDFKNRRNGIEVLRLGVNDSFGKSGKPSQLLDMFGLNSREIAYRIVSAKCPELINKFNFYM